MPDYQRAYNTGEAIFLTLVTFNRRPIFAEPDTFEGEGVVVGELMGWWAVPTLRLLHTARLYG
jgi:hypothetical protein